MTQEERILDYIKAHKTITNREAVINLGINSPTKRISNLIKAGTSIKREWITGKNRYGESCRYVQYSLGENNG